MKVTPNGRYFSFTVRLTNGRFLLEQEGGPRLHLTYDKIEEASLRGGVGCLTPSIGLKPPKIVLKCYQGDYISLRSDSGTFTARTVRLLNCLKDQYQSHFTG